MKKIIVFTILLAALWSCTNSSKNPQEKRQAQIMQVMDSLVNVNDIPGLNFSIIYANGQKENYSSGYANIEKKTPLNHGYSLFSGSIGKTYAVAILMQLVDDGSLKLTDKYIDHFRDVDLLTELPNMNDITIEMLLQHTSGLPRYVMKPSVWDTLAANPDKIWTYKDRLSFVFGDDAVHEAGKGWHYSDTNYILLGMLIEKITRNQYYDMVMAKILIPYRLVSTYPAVKRNIPHLPVGYSRLPEMFNMPNKVVIEGKYVFNPQMEWTGGGFASSTSDLARWASIYFQGKLFSDSLLAKITTPNPQAEKLEENLAYGMGSFIFQTNHGIAYGHTGFVPGFVSIFTYFPEQGVAVALQANCDYASEKMELIEYVDTMLEYLIVGSASSDEERK